MPIPALLIGAGIGSKLGAAILGNQQETKKRRRRRMRMLEAIQPLEALVRQAEFGPSESEGRIFQAVESRTLRDLANRGVLQSTIAAPSIAAAVAPFEERRQARRQSLIERLTAARLAIAGEPETPGAIDAFAGTLGEVGDLLALRGFEGLDATGGGSGEDSLEELLGLARKPDGSLERWHGPLERTGIGF